MKIAIVHDIFVQLGGAERVFLKFIDLYPKADVYVSLIHPDNFSLLKSRTNGKIHVAFINYLPFASYGPAYAKWLLRFYWQSLDLSGYDLVISSSHLFSAKSVITGSDTLHISYLHGIPRHLYTGYDETALLRYSFFRLLVSPIVYCLRMKDYADAQRPDKIFVNSLTTRNNVEKYYRRKSLVVYPPVRMPTTEKVPQSREKGEYYLCVSSCSKQKRIEIAIQTCNNLSLELIVVGEGPQKHHLQSIAGPTVHFTGRITDGELNKLYRHAKALIHCAVDEDFGIAPVEAMSHGLPVIAYRSGGLKETIVEGETGLFFNTCTAEALMKTMLDFSHQKFSPQKCRRRAKLFSEENFSKKIKREINKLLNK